MNMIIKALDFAYEAHKNQYRKGTKIPYFVHCVDVVSILIQNNAREPVVAAGAVHDTHEDKKYTGVTKEMLFAEFGPEITGLVMLVTEEDKSLSWKERKTKSLEKLMDSTLEHQMLICADKLSNGRDTVSNIKLHGDSYWNIFNAGKEDQAFYYYGVLRQLNKIRDKQMYWDYKEVVNELFVRH